jgi:histidyl-tRNA synthetase
MFRRERPQKGRYRQFYQMDVEVFGCASPYTDAQLIFMLNALLTRLSIADIVVHVNSLGCPQCRPGFRSALDKFLNRITDNLCADCLRRKDKNPLRVLDCKVPACRTAVEEAPAITDFLCEECDRHFKTLVEALTNLGIRFNLDKRLVRGLDYYTRTIFEFQTGTLGAQSAVAGGGRYDGLVKMLGGPDTPATGFAIGFDRLVEVAALDRYDYIRKPAVFIAALGKEAQAMAFEWICALNAAGIQTEMDFSDRSLKSQMKQADKMGAGYVAIVGENEIQKETIVLRNMNTKEQADVPLADAVAGMISALGDG